MGLRVASGTMKRRSRALSDWPRVTSRHLHEHRGNGRISRPKDRRRIRTPSSRTSMICMDNHKSGGRATINYLGCGICALLNSESCIDTLLTPCTLGQTCHWSICTGVYSDSLSHNRLPCEKALRPSSLSLELACDPLRGLLMA